MLVFLWTDILIWFLVCASLCVIYKLRLRPDFKIAASQLFHSKVALTSGFVLFVYLIIGLSDSIHFREYIHNPNYTSQADKHYYGDVISILDYVSKPWSDVTEKTFAAPFAETLYSKDRVVNDAGKLVEVYPALEYVKHADIKNILLNIIIIWLIVTLIFYSLYRGINHYFFKNNSDCLLKYEIDKNKNNSIDKQSNKSHTKFILLVLYGIALILAIIFSMYNEYHVLGTDKIGTDILYVTLKSVRTGLVIGTLTTIFMLPLALFFGTVAGYYGGYIDDLIVYIYTTLSSIPGVLLISAFILITQTQIALHPDWFETLAEQADIRLLALCMILGITSWSGLCRLLRAETLKLKNMDYVTAAKTMRVSNARIILRHIIPNLVHIIIINLAMGFSSLVLAEAVLSYIGVGVDPTTMSWGNMINSARLELSRDPIVWWPIMGAFIPMFIFVLSLNLFADELRDAFDPRVRLQ